MNEEFQGPWIQIDFGSAGKFKFPAKLIAHDRAAYYAKRDSSTTFDEEFDFTINNDDELYDWFKNNMRWSQVEKFAVRVKDDTTPDYEDLMGDAGIEVLR